MTGQITATGHSHPMTAEEMTAHLMFHVKPEALAELEAFRIMVAERNEVMNLVGPTTIPHYWSRHVLDSAQLLNHVPDARTWADLGAGAGFPGIVLAILLKHMPQEQEREGTLSATHPKVYLIDSLTKRCVFLNEAVRQFDLPAVVINDRAENLDLKVEVVTARAFAPFERLFTFAEGFFKRGAQGWFLKGESVENELETALIRWRFEAQLNPSLSDPRGRVVSIRRLSRVK